MQFAGTTIKLKFCDGYFDVEPDREVEDQIRKALSEFKEFMQSARKHGEDKQTLDHYWAQFDNDWQPRLNDFELVELRGCKRGYKAAAKEFELQNRMESQMRDSTMLPAMNRKDQVAFHVSNHNGGDEKLWADARANMTDQAYETTRQQIQDRYTELRDGLSQATEEIRHGKEPSLSFLLESQIEKEAERASRAEAFVKRYNELDNERER